MSQQSDSSSPIATRGVHAAASGAPRLTPAGADALPWYRREAWLALCLVAFVPLLIGIVAPKSWQLLLFALSGVTFTASIVQLVRTDRSPSRQ